MVFEAELSAAISRGWSLRKGSPSTEATTWKVLLVAVLIFDFELGSEDKQERVKELSLRWDGRVAVGADGASPLQREHRWVKVQSCCFGCHPVSPLSEAPEEPGVIYFSFWFSLRSCQTPFLN